MRVVDVPGADRLVLEHLVLDYNGTLACDGALLAGVDALLAALAADLELHVVTADTFGGARVGLADVPCRLVVLPPENQAEAKGEYVARLGASSTVAIGNGRNDAAMLAAAVLGIVVIQEEGASTEAIAAADVACPSIHAALEMLSKPDRLKATLRR
jgi:soluble P-type ATPase